MKIVYHDDLDGRASAWIVRKWKSRTPVPDTDQISCLPMNYGNRFPIGDIKEEEEVWIVDYSLDPSEFTALVGKRCLITWIDHHVTAINKLKNFKHLAGVRDTSEAACILTWKYCFLGEEIPRAILLTGDRDSWQWKYGRETANFCAGSYLYDTSPEAAFWEGVTQEDAPFRDVLDSGAIICNYRQMLYADLRRQIGWECSFEGHKCLAMNVAKAGAEALGASITGEMSDTYDILIPYYHDGTRFTVSLYSKPEVVHVGNIAAKYGGGGHPGAAGFQCRELPIYRDIPPTGFCPDPEKEL